MSVQDKDLAEKWHKQVEGIWHGCPGIFDKDGNYQGYVQADRSIYIDDEGTHLIRVDTKVNCQGPLRTRLETPQHLLTVSHVEEKRVYNGPDFYGCGYPYGTLILGNDYCIPWRTDNRVHVQLLPGEQLQAYSNTAIEGNQIVCVITGLYKLSRDYDTNEATRQMIEEHRNHEIAIAKNPHILERRATGTFHGKLETFTPDQKMVGETEVTWKHNPITQYRQEMNLTMTGAYERECRIERNRHENRYWFEDGFWGNGIAYGRAHFWRGNFKGETTRLIARDFKLEDGSLAVVWEAYRADTLEYVMHGVLKWTAD